MDIVTEIRRFNAGRDPERLRLKYRAMRGGALAFLRGSCHLFYARLATEVELPASPLGWICGDLHLENFGSYKGDNRLVYFDLNDFDEAVLAPAGWDLLRWLVSLEVAAEGLGIDTESRRTLPERALAVYAATLAAGRIGWVDRDQAEGGWARCWRGCANGGGPSSLRSAPSCIGSTASCAAMASARCRPRTRRVPR